MSEFGYPESCILCKSFDNCLEKNINLHVKPYHQEGNHFRLMLIGQDPTIFYKSERVHQVLMFDKETGQLKRWLKKLFEPEDLSSFTIYATNIVKCTFPKPPSTYRGKNFLLPYFENCKQYLIKEVTHFKPTLVLTLGEPANRYFTTLFNNSDMIGDKMQEAFGMKSDFFEAMIGNLKFLYSPCLHIKTFRVAEVYGERVENFKTALKKTLLDSLR